MTMHRHYNMGPTNYLLGHGRICNHRPPRIMKLEGSDAIVMSSTYDSTTGMHLFWDTHHKKILELLVDYSAACSAPAPTKVVDVDYSAACSAPAPTKVVDEVVSKYANLIHLTVPYMQYVSPSPILDKVENKVENDVLLGGYNITMNQRLYDIRSFEDRVSLLKAHKESLGHKLILDYLIKIKDFQKSHMGFKLDKSEMHCCEVRERIISYPYGLNVETDPDMVPPADQYFKLSYRFKQFRDYTGAIKQPLDIQVYLSKAALQYDISQLDGQDHLLITYTKFPQPVKHGNLSGKHLTFMYLKCTKHLCDHSEKNCDKSQFVASDLLNVFISKLHVVVENAPGSGELLEDMIMLYCADDLGEPLPSHADTSSFEYYDLSMPADSTMIMAACSGRDTVVEDIFG